MRGFDPVGVHALFSGFHTGIADDTQVPAGVTRDSEHGDFSPTGHSSLLAVNDNLVTREINGGLIVNNSTTFADLCSLHTENNQCYEIDAWVWFYSVTQDIPGFKVRVLIDGAYANEEAFQEWRYRSAQALQIGTSNSVQGQIGTSGNSASAADPGVVHIHGVVRQLGGYTIHVQAAQWSAVAEDTRFYGYLTLRRIGAYN